MMFVCNYTEVQRQIVGECAQAMSMIRDAETDRLIWEILQADKIFFVGVGRVLLSLESICKRFNHIGLKAYYVGEVSEPAITGQDLLIAASGSGESLYPLVIAQKAKEWKARIALISSNPDSSLARIADLFVRIPVRTKLSLPGELASIQPMTTLFEQCLLLYGDTLAKMIIERRNLNMDTLWRYHANLE